MGFQLLLISQVVLRSATIITGILPLKTYTIFIGTALPMNAILTLVGLSGRRDEGRRPRERERTDRKRKRTPAKTIRKILVECTRRQRKGETERDGG